MDGHSVFLLCLLCFVWGKGKGRGETEKGIQWSVIGIQSGASKGIPRGETDSAIESRMLVTEYFKPRQQAPQIKNKG